MSPKQAKLIGDQGGDWNAGPEVLRRVFFIHPQSLKKYDNKVNGSSTSQNGGSQSVSEDTFALRQVPKCQIGLLQRETQGSILIKSPSFGFCTNGHISEKLGPSPGYFQKFILIQMDIIPVSKWQRQTKCRRNEKLSFPLNLIKKGCSENLKESNCGCQSPEMSSNSQKSQMSWHVRAGGDLQNYLM